MNKLTPTQNKVLAWELIEHGAPAFLGRPRRRLGDVCTVVAGGSRVCSADATATSGSLMQAHPNLVNRVTSGQYSQGGNSIGNALALAQAVYNSNPAALTQNQWSLLQSAGIIASTLPFSSASQLPASQATAATAAVPTTASTDIMLGTFDLTAFVEGIPWWGWAIGAGGVLLLMRGSGQKRGRR
jgi:hypothetical protein